MADYIKKNASRQYNIELLMTPIFSICTDQWLMKRMKRRYKESM